MSTEPLVDYDTLAGKLGEALSPFMNRPNTPMIRENMQWSVIHVFLELLPDQPVMDWVKVIVSSGTLESTSDPGKINLRIIPKDECPEWLRAHIKQMETPA